MGTKSERYVVYKERQADRVTAASGTGAHTLIRSDGAAGFTNARAADPTVRADLNTADNPLTNREGTFNLTSVAGIQYHDREYEDAFMNPYVAAVTLTDTDIAAADTGNQFTSATSGKFDSFVGYEGHPIVISGLTQQSGATNYARIVSVTTGGSPAMVISSHFDLADEAASASVTISKPRDIVPGVIDYWSTLEESRGSAANDFTPWYSALCGGMTFTAPANGERITNAFNYMCAMRAISGSGVMAATSIFTTPTAQPSTRSITSSMVNVVREGGTVSTLGLNNWDFQIQNPLTGDNPQGGVGARCFARTKRAITGNVVFLRDSDTASAEVIALIGKQLQTSTAETTSELWFEIDTVDSGTTYKTIILLPAVRYNGLAPNPGGDGSHELLPFPFVCEKDAYGHMLYRSDIGTS